MKRSEINRAFRDATACFAAHSWALPPKPRWDITDFALGDFSRWGLTLVTLASEAEYCEKIMYARRGQVTPCHAHRKKKEDIICRVGELTVRIWPTKPNPGSERTANITIAGDGVPTIIFAGQQLALGAGSRVTLPPGVWHELIATSDECIIGEVSTANDDVSDNLFLDQTIGRFPSIEEDEPAAVRLARET